MIGDTIWGLVPDALPAMEFAPISPGEIVRLDNIAAEQPSLTHFPGAPAGLPPGVHVHILLDRKTLLESALQDPGVGGVGGRMDREGRLEAGALGIV